MIVPTKSLDPLLDAFVPGQLSEIVGPWSSGSSSLLLALMAKATALEGQVALVDWADSFDPHSAVAAGMDLRRLLWVKCSGQLRTALSATDLLVRCPGVALVVLDLGDLPPARQHPLSRTLCLRLQRAVEGRATKLVLRTPHRMAGSTAALVVATRRIKSQWSGRPRPTRLAGFSVEARILRSRRWPHGRESSFSWVIEGPL